MDKAWKRRERQIARDFNTNRTPLSGGCSRITRSDTLHGKLFIEIKTRQKHTAVTLYDKTAELAIEENKIPVVALCENGRQGYWLIIRPEHISEIYRQYGGKDG